jgi:hypothetical protein
MENNLRELDGIIIVQYFNISILIFCHYTITIKHWLSIYTSMKPSLLLLKLLALALNSLDTLSDIE